MECLLKTMSVLNAIYLLYGILDVLGTIVVTVAFLRGNPAYDLLPVLLLWLELVIIFTAFQLGQTALVTLDGKQLRRFGTYVLIGLLTQIVGECLMLSNPVYWNEVAQRIQNELIAIDIFIYGFQVVLAIFAFVSAKRSNIQQPNV